MGRVVGPLVHEPAEQAEQTLAGIAPHRAVHARSVVDEDRFVAVRFDDMVELVVDDLDRLFPRDALELALAALARTLHRVEQAVGAVQPAAHGATAQAGARLQVVVTDVVRFHVRDLAVFDMPLEHAVAAAVHVALAPGDLLACGRIRRHRLLGEYSLCCRSSCRSGCSQGARRLDERAARWIQRCHITSSCYTSLRSPRKSDAAHSPARCDAKPPLFARTALFV